jgi:hypothetical protein
MSLVQKAPDRSKGLHISREDQTANMSTYPIVSLQNNRNQSNAIQNDSIGPQTGTMTLNVNRSLIVNRTT